jgi:hypothetical protein
VPLPATEVTARRQPVRSTVSFSTSISGTVAHRRATSFLIRRRFPGSGAACSGVSRIAPAGRSVMSTQGRPGTASSSSPSAAVISLRKAPVNSAGSSGLRKLA